MYPFLNGEKIGYCDYLISLDVYEKFNSTTWGIRCVLKNVLDKVSFAHLDKDNLYNVLPKYVAESFPYNNELPKVHKEGDVWIVKPIGLAAHSGYGITIVTKKEDIPIATKEIGKMKAVIQRYIMNPVLFEGRKFHLRVHLMITSWGKHHVYPYFRILTAKNPYVQSDWDNKEVHDTHFKSTDGDYSWSQNNEEIHILCDELAQTIKPVVYEESKFAYHILGLDVMIADKLYLIEVNMYPGKRARNNKAYEWHEGFIDWEIDCVRHFFSRWNMTYIKY